MISTGTTALATTSATAVSAFQPATFAATVGTKYTTFRTAHVINTGSNPGFVTFNGGTNDWDWHYFPVGMVSFQFIDGQCDVSQIKIKRIGSNDVTGTYITLYN